MNVAPAIAAARTSLPAMTIRNGQDVEGRVDSPADSLPADSAPSGAASAAAASSNADPLTARYPMIAFSFDQDASRLVMLYRDPASGQTVDQIPTETALKQYKEAHQQARGPALTLTVGGKDDAGTAPDTTGGTSPATGGTIVGSGSGPGAAHAGAARASGGAPPATPAAAGSWAVPLSAAPAAGSGGPAGAGAMGHVNVVI